MIRKARISDVQAMTRLGLAALEKKGMENLVISRSKVNEAIRDCIVRNDQFAWVAERGDKVIGMIVVQVFPMLFHERSQATVIQYQSSNVIDQVKLMIRFMWWVKGRRVIKTIALLEEDGNPIIARLLVKLGFIADQKSWIKVR